ncbi:MAG: hypothetical protein LBH91_08515 [Prevotellaceae bacterium]|jgi:hypothetical protein|nr:hypothetical protein [Prevotellaceae bacterium]
MKKFYKALLYLMLVLGIGSGAILLAIYNIINIPTWLAIVLLVFAIISFGWLLSKTGKGKK